ncbi:hypothetical protein HPB47_020413 [Ixodes persulcatus]|uniref:Uncharacterized protein n=1 Tax=Ixodes persulcatus TaxID=34615 RepID=A0AC60QFN3_IXOPE|nr:hypothetical protein HPB47_020413 [Ixodes persulcatus]
MNWSAKLQRLLQHFDITRISFYHENCMPFFIGDQQVGLIRPNDWMHLSQYKEAFHYDIKTNRVVLNPSWKTYDERSAKMESLMQEVRRKKIFKTLHGWRNEVTGGVCVGYGITECIRKEAQEEASLPENLLNCIRPAGNVSFVYEDERGIFPETVFVFDLELPAEFQPLCSDDEVDEFYLMTVPECPPVPGDVTVYRKVSGRSEGRHRRKSQPNYCQLMDTVHMPLHNFYPSAIVPTGDGPHFYNNSSSI